ncbi:N-acetylmuramic acid 6-phosphate etherase [Alteromonas sp. 5E99-2]|uniref:N-acetylmuramic acid 6-phosphate etherase n=1 Tax=Alteromonas sp. 5E99-2 TaxID=2817683 RepID=UPI001A982DA6|nr:N-acetylmuramic acid 6-phosphate etherase [Alteromonas sp. 5E99-2]MBO1254579.1 N-acetylmuramic acid 6-phosphate etherase [Alteromonas sp. 5E99-2]
MSSPSDSLTVDNIINELQAMSSEQVNPESNELDILTTLDLVALINREDHKVAPAISQVLPSIAACVDEAVKSIQQGGRLIYIGAGTSGRLGILDAAECRPTFSVPDNLVVGVIAGGNTAIQHAVEGAEDNTEQGITDLKALSLSAKDTLVGIAASGRTPYVLGALHYAQSLGCKTAGISCNQNSQLLMAADIAILADVGPEVLTGSTRMKAGTAQKLILNMLSTATMVKLGKTYGNLMVDVNATNAKLEARAVRIVMQATECTKDIAQHALQQSNNQAKLAILIVLTGLDVTEAKTLLCAQKGYLRNAINEAN